ncbi:hypothetical protein ACFQ21_18100 [Ohtaekwangia kribbensis]|uniref:Uncharacterized protein n=1 Tax=Ohtaekwangia kribbensis TaxID=688913 RepID=A0ABW3K891_9BACT
MKYKYGVSTSDNHAQKHISFTHRLSFSKRTNSSVKQFLADIEVK